jgi:hypothetical protein
MPSKSARYTEQEGIFIKALARAGDPAYAAHKAGYRSTGAVSKKMNNPAIISAVEAERARILMEQALPLAIAAQLELLQAPTPASVRARMVEFTKQEWKEYQEARGMGGRDQADLTPEEIAREIDMLTTLAAAQAVDVSPVDVEEVDLDPFA